MNTVWKLWQNEDIRRRAMSFLFILAIVFGFYWFGEWLSSTWQENLDKQIAVDRAWRAQFPVLEFDSRYSMKNGKLVGTVCLDGFRLLVVGEANPEITQLFVCQNGMTVPAMCGKEPSVPRE